jgi:putative transposase
LVVPLSLIALQSTAGQWMRQNGISVVRTRKHKVTTDSNHKFNIAPNLLDRNFIADQPNQKWAGDITYIWMREGWLYLAVILDLHSRRVIGWAVSNRMKRDLAIRALKMAIAFRSPPKGCIHHTDRGSQNCSHDYQKILRQHGFKVSMSGKGNCYDNAAVETFFKTIKAEGTQRWAEKVLSPSNGRWLKRTLGAELKHAGRVITGRANWCDWATM